MSSQEGEIVISVDEEDEEESEITKEKQNRCMQYLAYLGSERTSLGKEAGLCEVLKHKDCFRLCPITVAGVKQNKDCVKSKNFEEDKVLSKHVSEKYNKVVKIWSKYINEFSAMIYQYLPVHWTTTKLDTKRRNSGEFVFQVFMDTHTEVMALSNSIHRSEMSMSFLKMMIDFYVNCLESLGPIEKPKQMENEIFQSFVAFADVWQEKFMNLVTEMKQVKGFKYATKLEFLFGLYQIQKLREIFQGDETFISEVEKSLLDNHNMWEALSAVRD